MHTPTVAIAVVGDPIAEPTGALLNRLTHRMHILEANGESYRLAESRRRLKSRKKPA